MFTGIIEDIGTIRQLNRKGTDLVLVVQTALEMDSINKGDSIAVDGVCLTVTKKTADSLFFDVSHETVSATTLCNKTAGVKVHLERALVFGGRLGGHLVSGHVDGVAEVISCTSKGENLDLTFKVPEEIKHYLVPKGSVAINGVSLTVNEPDQDVFKVTLVPYTQKNTCLQEIHIEEKANIEADLIGKYLRHFVQNMANEGSGALKKNRLDEQFLQEHGFMK